MEFVSKWLWTGLAAAAAGTATGMFMVGKSAGEQPYLPEEPVPAAEQTILAATEPSHQETAYLLKLTGDTLRIYAGDEKDPCAEYELPAGWLPDYDRIVLEYGLRVGSAAELRSLIEDYIS